MTQKMEEMFNEVQMAGGIYTAKSLVVTGTTCTLPATTTIGGLTVSTANAVTAKSATAVSATAGAVAAGAPIVMNSNGITIECTTDVPTHNRPIGSICINLGGNSASTRMYIATSAAGAWTAFTTAA